MINFVIAGIIAFLVYRGIKSYFKSGGSCCGDCAGCHGACGGKEL